MKLYRQVSTNERMPNKDGNYFVFTDEGFGLTTESLEIFKRRDFIKYQDCKDGKCEPKSNKSIENAKPNIYKPTELQAKPSKLNDLSWD